MVPRETGNGRATGPTVHRPADGASARGYSAAPGVYVPKLQMLPSPSRAM